MDPRKPELSEAFLSALRDLVRLLRETQREGVVIGGVAVGLQGYPRVTGDVDMLLAAEGMNLAQLIERTLQLGFEPRVPNLLEWARRNYVIKLVHTESRVPIDISLAYTPLELEIIRESNRITVYDITVPVARPEDLIIMKSVAQRSIDLVDIHELYQLHADQINLQRVRYWVEQFAEALEEPDLWAKVEPWLKQDT
ncbi:MAG: nucleotidyltransferase [Fimbriimonadales bacterium]|nr:nucleotidyltransferase [Fimbriimonadales bacterium]